MNSGIYQILNKINGKRYIGSAVNLQRRKRLHFYYLRSNSHANIILQQAYQKYEEAALNFEVLEYVGNIDDLIKKEQLYIDKYLSFKKEYGYNISPTAGSTLGVPAWNKGIPRTQEVKEKLKKANIGRIPSPESIIKCRETKSKKPVFKHTEIHKLKMSELRKGKANPFFGKKQSQEHLQKISSLFTKSGNPAARLVINLETGIFYGSILEAAESINIPRTSLQCMLCGRYKNKTSFIYV